MYTLRNLLFIHLIAFAAPSNCHIAYINHKSQKKPQKLIEHNRRQATVTNHGGKTANLGKWILITRYLGGRLGNATVSWKATKATTRLLSFARSMGLESCICTFTILYKRVTFTNYNIFSTMETEKQKHAWMRKSVKAVKFWAFCLRRVVLHLFLNTRISQQTRRQRRANCSKTSSAEQIDIVSAEWTLHDKHPTHWSGGV